MTSTAVQKHGTDTAPPIPRPIFMRGLPATREDVRRTLINLRERLSNRCAPDLLGRVDLVLAEVMTNIVKHGTPPALPDGTTGRTRPHLIHLSVCGHDGGVACAISDYGPPIPPTVFETSGFEGDAATPLCDWPEGGFGWLLIRNLTRSLTYYREGGRNLLIFTVPSDENEPPGTNAA